MTDIEMVRLNVRDQTTPYIFDDTTISSLLSSYGSDVNMVSYHLWTIRAGDKALRVFKFQVDGRMVDKTMQPSECLKLAAIFKGLALLAPADGLAEITWTNAFDPPEEM